MRVIKTTSYEKIAQDRYQEYDHRDTEPSISRIEKTFEDVGFRHIGSILRGDRKIPIEVSDTFNPEMAPEPDDFREGDTGRPAVLTDGEKSKFIDLLMERQREESRPPEVDQYGEQW